MQVLKADVNLERILEEVITSGYCIRRSLATTKVVKALIKEMSRHNLEVGDHVSHPIQPGTLREVQQLHARSYKYLDDSQVPTSSQVCRRLASDFEHLWGKYPELKNWLLSEIGYQRYRDHNDWISPHRDRKSDAILSITITLEGWAWLNIYQANSDPVDYKNLTRIDSILTGPGTVMFLRAPGLGSGEQVIHEVMPPIKGHRDIVNLRMRKTTLPQPK